MGKREECKDSVTKGYPEVGECRESWADFSGASTEPYHPSFNKNIWNI